MNKQYLSGPNLWTEYEFTDDQGNKHWFHLFGEKHTIDSNDLCSKVNSVDFVDFLENVFIQAFQSKINTNLFLEIPYKLNVKAIDEKNYLSRIYLQFRDCFTPTKKCIYHPYVHFHTTDIRSTYKFKNDKFSSDIPTTVYQLVKIYILKLLKQITKLKLDIRNKVLETNIFKTASFIQILVDLYLPKNAEVFKVLLGNSNYRDEISKIMNTILLEWNPDMYLEKDFRMLGQTMERLYQLHKIRNNKQIFVLKHQLDELRKDKIMFRGVNMADWIYSFVTQTTNKYQEVQLPIFENAWSKIYLQLLESDLSKKKDLDKIIQLFQEFQNDLSLPLTVMDSTLLDSFILTRMFRRYRKTPEENPVLTFIYEGLNHVQLQSIFFSQVLHLKPLNVVKGSKEHPRCLKIDIEKDFDVLQYAEHVKLVKLNKKDRK